MAFILGLWSEILPAEKIPTVISFCFEIFSKILIVSSYKYLVINPWSKITLTSSCLSLFVFVRTNKSLMKFAGSK